MKLCSKLFILIYLLNGLTVCVLGEDGVPTEVITQTYRNSMSAASETYRLSLADAIATADYAVVYRLDFDIEPCKDRYRSRNCGRNPVPDSLFPIYPMGTTAKVMDRKICSREQAEQLAALVSQSLRQANGPTDWCHFPIHGLRLYKNNKEIFETSFCWVCNTFTISYPDRSTLLPVDSEPLKKLLTEILPVPEQEKQRFKDKHPNLPLKK